jgi:hypothetical protein
MKRTMYDTKMIALSFVGNNSDQFIFSNMINSNFCGWYNVHKYSPRPTAAVYFYCGQIHYMLNQLLEDTVEYNIHDIIFSHFDNLYTKIMIKPLKQYFFPIYSKTKLSLFFCKATSIALNPGPSIANCYDFPNPARNFLFLQYIRFSLFEL